MNRNVIAKRILESIELRVGDTLCPKDDLKV